MGTSFRIFIKEDSKEEFENFFSRIFSREGKDKCKLQIGQDHHDMRNVYIEGVVVGDDRQCLLSVIDISAWNH